MRAVRMGGYGRTATAKVLIAFSLVVGGAAIAAQGDSGDTSNGATNYTFHGAGRWWRAIGPQAELTTFDGPYNNATGHPSQIYMAFWKEPESGNTTGLASALDPKSIQVKHALGTTFYYPATEPAPPDPSTRGYTAENFAVADKLVRVFPHVRKLFPKGIDASGCHMGDVQFYLLRGRGMSGAFLVGWLAKENLINVAVMPERTLKGSLASILDNLNYYQSGGLVEFMEFGSYFYYLSRVASSHGLDTSMTGTAGSACPPAPIATEAGIQLPKGWTRALDALKKHNPPPISRDTPNPN